MQCLSVAWDVQGEQDKEFFMCDRPPPNPTNLTRPAGIVYVNISVVAAIYYTTLGKLAGTRKPNVLPNLQDEDVGGLSVSACSPC